MPLQYVTLTLDLYDGQGNLIITGTAALTPTAQLTDAVDNQLIVQAPVPGVFRSGSAPQVKLLATDSTNLTPSNWSWTIAYTGVPGSPPAYTFKLPAGPQTFTATNGTPCVFTGSGAGYLNSTGVQLSGGSLPAGFAAGTTYYVTAASGSAFQLAASAGGAALASTSTGSGSVIAVQSWLSSL